MSTTSATTTTTPSSSSSTANATSSLSSVVSNSAPPSSEITTAATTLSTTNFSTMSISASTSSFSSSAVTSVMSSSTPSESLSILSSTLTASESSISSESSTSSESSSSSESPTTSSSSISTIPSPTSSTLPSSTSSSTQDPSTTTSQTISSTTTEPATTLSSTSSSSLAPLTTSTSSAVEPTLAATTLIVPTTRTRTANNAPSVSGVFSETTITSIFTTTSNGQVVTTTQVSVSQTLIPNKTNSKDDSSFFQNTGAVAGVFVVVGLAAASIFLWILFALRRRRRTRRLEHDTAVSATLAAAGFHRTPLDDDDENENANGSRRSRFGSPEVEMHNRTSSGFASSIPSGARTSAYFDSFQPDDPDVFNPYRDYVVDTPAPASGTIPPSSAFLNGPYRDRTSSGGEHTHEHSASGSYEPLLASYYRQEQATSLSVPPAAADLPNHPPNPPPRNPLRLSDAGRSPPLGVLSKTLPDIAPADPKSTTGDSTVCSSESVGDDRLDPGLRQRMNEETDRASQRDLKDEEDYSRPVLGVRNLPNASEASQEA